jgi:hypothetical protein
VAVGSGISRRRRRAPWARLTILPYGYYKLERQTRRDMAR